MERLIEIRAWDRIRQRMFYPEPYDNGKSKCPDALKGKVCPGRLVDQHGNIVHLDDVLMYDYYIPMLKVGHCDQHGKQIWEGDIILMHWNGCLATVTYGRTLAGNGMAYSGFYLKAKNKDYMLDGTITIVGNIYEAR